MITHISGIRRLGHSWFTYYLVACLVPNHYLNPCWLFEIIINGKKRQSDRAFPLLTWLALTTGSCRALCLESQIINIKLKKKKNQQKVPGPPKLSASDRHTGANFQHCWQQMQSFLSFWFPDMRLATWPTLQHPLGIFPLYTDSLHLVG